MKKIEGKLKVKKSNKSDAMFQNTSSVTAFGASSLFLMGVRWGRTAMPLLRRMKPVSPQPCLQKPFCLLNLPSWQQLCKSSREQVFSVVEVPMGFMMTMMTTVSFVTQGRRSPSACSKQRAEGSQRDPNDPWQSFRNVTLPGLQHWSWRSSAWSIFRWKKKIWKLLSYHILR